MSDNVVWHPAKVERGDREKLNGHKGACLWFTGLPSSGKSTLAVEIEKILYEKGIHTYILDGDNIRHGLNKDLGFSDADRKENIRRIGEVSNLFVDAGYIVLTAFISPFREDRKIVRDLMHENKFIEIFVDCDVDTCSKRDPKGLYKKAMNGEIKEFTGISSPYEAPENPEINLDNRDGKLEENVKLILQYLNENGLIEKEINH